MTPSDPSKGLKMGYLSKKWDEEQRKRQKPSLTCGLTFDNFQQICHSMTDSYAKFSAKTFVSKSWHPQIPLSGSKWGIMLEMRRKTKKMAKIKFDMWANLWHFSTNLLFYDWFLSKIWCPTFLRLKVDTLRSLQRA